jgi:hypothetical protein
MTHRPSSPRSALAPALVRVIVNVVVVVVVTLAPPPTYAADTTTTPVLTPPSPTPPRDDPGPPPSLADLEAPEIGFSLAATGQITRLAGTNAALAGASLNLLFRDLVGVGVASYQGATRIQRAEESSRLAYAERGLVFEAAPTFGLASAGRIAAFVGLAYASREASPTSRPRLVGSVLAPEFGYTGRLVPWLELGFTVGYRFVIATGRDDAVARHGLSAGFGAVTLATGRF